MLLNSRVFVSTKFAICPNMMLTKRSTRTAQQVTFVKAETSNRTRASVRSRGVTQKRERDASLSSLSTLSGEETPVIAEPASKIPNISAASKKEGQAKAVNDPSPGDQKRVDNEWKLGAHVSAAGGVENAIVNAAAVGANAFALFVKSQRKWTSPPLSETSIKLFKERMETFGYAPQHVLPHGSYLINLGNPDSEKREKSYSCFVDDLKRCEQLGLTLYNFHPGSTVGRASPEESIKFIAECLNRAHKETSFVTTVIENMAGAGNVIGGPFSHLSGIISLVEDKLRVGVCLDTCHAFAEGYDIRELAGYNSVVEEFDREVGLKYLKAWHINDSKVGLKSHKDRHENIGCGEIGLGTFSYIIHDPRMKDLPLILETPTFDQPGIWAHEITMLNKVSGMSIGEETGELVQELKELIKKTESASKKGTVRKIKKPPVKKQKKGGDGDS